MCVYRIRRKMELKVGERVERMGRGEGEEGDYCHEWSVERGPL